MNRMAERASICLGGIGYGSAARFSRMRTRSPHAPELPHAVEQALRVAHRRHVGIGDEKHRVGGVQRGDGHRIDLAAGVDEDVVVLPRQQAEHFFERARVGRAGPVEVVRPAENVQP